MITALFRQPHWLRVAERVQLVPACYSCVQDLMSAADEICTGQHRSAEYTADF